MEVNIYEIEVYTMRIWMLINEADEYAWFEPAEKWDWNRMRSFDGRNHKETWEPIKIIRMEPELEQEFGDFPCFSDGVQIFSDRVIDVIEEMIGNSVEFLPTITDEGVFWLVNITNVVNCIDYEKSQFRSFSSSGRIMVFEKYSFVEEKVRNEDIFRIVDMPYYRPFVSDRFKEVIEANDFKGFIFKLVWDSEAE